MTGLPTYLIGLGARTTYKCSTFVLLEESPGVSAAPRGSRFRVGAAQRSVLAGGKPPVTSALTLGSDTAPTVGDCGGGEAVQALGGVAVGSVVTAGPSVATWLPGPSKVESKIVRWEQFQSYREMIARGSLRGRMVLASARVSLSQLV